MIVLIQIIILLIISKKLKNIKLKIYLVLERMEIINYLQNIPQLSKFLKIKILKKHLCLLEHFIKVKKVEIFIIKLFYKDN